MAKVLVTRRIPEAGLELLRAHFEVILNEADRALTRAELLEAVRDVDGVLCLPCQDFLVALEPTRAGKHLVD